MSATLATLIIYCILINPAIFCLMNHGRKGLVGWYLLTIFCVLRIVGAVLQRHNQKTDSKSADATIISNIGLSPLLIAVEAILHEARTAKYSDLNRRVELIKMINYHAIVITGLVLILMGVLNETKEAIPTPNTMMKVGVILLFLAWVGLSVWAGNSLRASTQNSALIPAYDDAVILVYGILGALPFLGIRALYSLIFTLSTSTGFKESQAAKYTMSVAPEIIVVIVMVAAGIWTKRMSKTRKQNNQEHVVAQSELGSDSNSKIGLMDRTRQIN